MGDSGAGAKRRSGKEKTGKTGIQPTIPGTPGKRVGMQKWKKETSSHTRGGTVGLNISPGDYRTDVQPIGPALVQEKRVPASGKKATLGGKGASVCGGGGLRLDGMAKKV